MHDPAMSSALTPSEAIKSRVALPPGLPRPNPTSAVWQNPPHPTVADAQSATLPSKVDIAVIGSGITGCAAAQALLSASPTLRVTVLEARQAVSGATGRNGGHLLSDSSSLIPKLVPAIGVEAATEVARFSDANIARIKEVVAGLGQAERDAVELREVIGSAAFGDEETLAAAQEGLKVLEQVHPGSSLHHRIIPAEEATKKYKYNKHVAGAVEQQGAAALWPYRLITAVLRQLLDNYPDRFTLETNTPVHSIEHGNTEGSGYQYSLTTPRGIIRAGKVIHCTNGFAGHLVPKLPGRLFPLRGTMSTQQPAPSFPNLGQEVSWSYFCKPNMDTETGVFSAGLYYAQQNARTGAIFIGGEAQKMEDLLSSDDSVIAQEARASLCSVMSRIYDADVSPVGEQKVWSGILGFTSDGLPLVGRLSEGLTGRSGDGEWIAAGFNGHGMDKCWLTGEAVATMAMEGAPPEGFPRAFMELLKEALDVVHGVADVNLEDPVALAPVLAHAVHRVDAPLGNVQGDLVARDPLVGERADDVARDGGAKLPPLGAHLVAGDAVELLARHVGPLAEAVPHAAPERLEGVAQALLGRVVAEDKGAAKVGLPGLEDGAQVDDEDVVGLHDAVGRVLLKGTQRVGPAAHDALVPVRAHAVPPLAELVDGVAELLLRHARPDEVALDLGEERRRLGLRVEERRGVGGGAVVVRPDLGRGGGLSATVAIVV
ncbi:FAD dependent oxidoreductase superfamily protein [Purpureocillium lavendulum]|uniref:FAD dependent oxidoreductase superfamily protein n=1 Tax=Purpureocillium lavendulum TaxID=1247861 RepID=A0AB34FT34_9HYPO|nr:FAD dependent oxidoreductase superfamily protein [Purpureocillium lavendulum]